MYKILPFIFFPKYHSNFREGLCWCKCACVLSVYSQEVFFAFCWHQLLFKLPRLLMPSSTVFYRRSSFLESLVLSTTSNPLGAAHSAMTILNGSPRESPRYLVFSYALAHFIFFFSPHCPVKCMYKDATTLNSQMGIRYYSRSCPGLSRSLFRSVIQPTCTWMTIWIDWAYLLIG